MMTGFNPSEVSASINKVETAYIDLLNALHGKTQTDFVNPMGEIWACNQAIRFFNDGFKPSVDDILKESFETFQSVVETMNQAATNWARQTESEWGTMAFSGELKNIDVSSIKENIAENRGIIEDEAMNTTNVLPAIVSESESALDSAVNAVNTCGFLDKADAQVSALVNSLEGIKTSIAEVVTEETNAVKNAITSTVEEYGSLASTTADTFTAE